MTEAREIIESKVLLMCGNTAWEDGRTTGGEVADAIITALREAGFAVVPVKPTVEMLKPFAVVLCHGQGITDPDRPQPPHGEYPLWYERCGPMQSAFDEMLKAAQGGE